MVDLLARGLLEAHPWPWVGFRVRDYSARFWSAGLIRTLSPTPMTQRPPTKQQQVYYDEDLDDRDYANLLLPRAAYRSPAVRSYTIWIIFACVGIFFLDLILMLLGIGGFVVVYGEEVPMGRLHYLGHFSQYFAIRRLEVWRFLTFQFLHGNL